MPRLRVALLSVVIAAGAAACGTAGSSSFTLAPAPPSSSQPSAAPTSSPSASTGTGSASSLAGQTIELNEWKVDVATSLKSGKMDFTIVNKGVAPHELLIFKSDLDPTAYPTDAAGDITEDGAGVTLVSDGENIAPAGSQARTVDLAPGTYLFVCNIAGHFKNGMFKVVTVTQ